MAMINVDENMNLDFNDEAWNNANFTTLRGLLTQMKPRIPCQLAGVGKSTSSKWPKLSAASIWHDFNLNTLNESYSPVLDNLIPHQGLQCPGPFQELGHLTINAAQDITVMIHWSGSLMIPALQLAKDQLRLYPGVMLSHQCSTTANPLSIKATGAVVAAKADHMISLDDFPPQVLLVGIGRPSCGWTTNSYLQIQASKPDHESGWPFRRLAKLCEIAETRCGYIQTDKELVACRFSRRNGNRLKMDVMPVPWTKYMASRYLHRISPSGGLVCWPYQHRITALSSTKLK